MKALYTIIIALTIILFSNRVSAQTTTIHPSLINHIHADKVKHFGVGALVAGSAQIVAYQLTNSRGKAMLIGFGTGVAAGIAKELYDMTGRGTPSFKDALWTSAGAGLASVSLHYTIQAKPHTASGL